MSSYENWSQKVFEKFTLTLKRFRKFISWPFHVSVLLTFTTELFFQKLSIWGGGFLFFSDKKCSRPSKIFKTWDMDLKMLPSSPPNSNWLTNQISAQKTSIKYIFSKKVSRGGILFFTQTTLQNTLIVLGELRRYF